MNKKQNEMWAVIIGFNSELNVWEVLFIENKGISCLDRTKYHNVAIKSRKKFINDLRNGVLLKETKRVWKYLK